MRCARNRSCADSAVASHMACTVSQISLAVGVQVKGRGLSFQGTRLRLILSIRSRTLVNEPRRICLRVRVAIHRPTWFSHDAPVGVKCRS
jgi:hypothetical protein